MNAPSAVQDKTIRLYTFLQELAKLRIKPQRSYGKDVSVYWFADLPQHPNVHNIARESSAHEGCWLEVTRVQLTPNPVLPESLKEWVEGDPASSSRSLQVLEKRLVVKPQEDPEQGAEFETVLLSDHPEVQAAWENYQQKWSLWSQENELNKQVNQWYNTLFQLYQNQQASGEAYELLVGAGMLHWSGAGKDNIRRHLLYAPCRLEFDAQQATIRLLALEDSQIRFEQDLLDPDQRPPTEVQQQVGELIQNLPDFWDRLQMETILKSWTNGLGHEADFQMTLERPTGEKLRVPTMRWAPAIVLRRRVERSIARSFEEITRQVKDIDTPPELMARLVEEPAVVNRLYSSAEGQSVGSSSDEVYFPLPSNEEQKQILEKLKQQKGVVVQGPPGTGKSHTIANLVTHLLATRQKVLVTSHTARALQVLKDKLPQEVAALCVTHLREGSNAKEALQRSVETIMSRHDNWDSARDHNRISQLERQLSTLRHDESLLLHQLKEIREQETHPHDNKFRYQGTAQQIAAQVKHDSEKYDWLRPYARDLRDTVDPGRLAQYLALSRKYPDADNEEYHQYVPAISDLFSPETYVLLVQQEQEALQGLQRHQRPDVLQAHQTMQRLTETAQGALVESMQKFSGLHRSLRKDAPEWAERAIRKVIKGDLHDFEALLELTCRQIPHLQQHFEVAGELTVTGLDRPLQTVLVDARGLLTHLEGGGGMGLLPFMRPKPVQAAQYIIQNVKANGLACNTLPQVKLLVAHLEVHATLEQLNKAWAFTQEPDISLVAGQISRYKDRVKWLELLFGLRKAYLDFRSKFDPLNTDEPDWTSSGSLQAYQDALELGQAERKHREAQDKVQQVHQRLERLIQTHVNPHQACSEMLQALRNHDPAGYTAAYNRVKGLMANREEIKQLLALKTDLRKQAPTVVQQIGENPGHPDWDRVIPQLLDARRFLQAEEWIEALARPERQRELEETLLNCRQSIRSTLRDLATAKAWESALSNLTHDEIQNLKVWQAMEGKVGKGTGKNAYVFRQKAREALEKARSAIPAWIMPVHIVAENFNPREGMFDVVIIDEASQSGLEALFLCFIARKIIVVGDPEQIEPEAIGISSEQTGALARRYIPDLHLKDVLMEADTSLFKIADIVFGNRLVLREHFRCMPEIINFSTKLAYRNKPLIPLRQFGAKRLPPIVTQHVLGAHDGKGTSLNEVEADMVVQRIAECCKNPAYEGKSFGVISLIGDDQAQLIRERLLDAIGAEEMERRNLICGNAYSFQGDERDVIFLSMVTPPKADRRIAKIGTDSKQLKPRFNVSVSRARDQVWLFHSLQLSDLNPEDIRFFLLSYCLNPETTAIDTLGATEKLELQRKAQQKGRGQYKPPAPFDSWFEVDVYLQVVERGYRVLPQQEVSGYRLDLVVEGAAGKLAVECDGDFWHGPDRYEQDVYRQQVLERAGWQFWRVRGSTYYRSPETALQSLWETLAERGIRPMGAEDQIQVSVQLDPGAPLTADQQRELEEFEHDPEHEAIEDFFEELESEEAIQAEDDSLVLTASGTTGLELGHQEDHPDVQGSLFSEVMDQEPLVSSEELDAAFKASPKAEVVLDTVYGFTSEEEARSKVWPFVAWKERHLPNPRGRSREVVAEGLVEIIRAEGPIQAFRAMKLYGKASDVMVKGEVWTDLQNAMKHARSKLGVVLEQEFARTDLAYRVARMEGTPRVIVRERGTRELYEIPPFEMAALMEMILQRKSYQVNTLRGREELYRHMLEVYQLKRLTDKVYTTFDDALKLVR